MSKQSEDDVKKTLKKNEKWLEAQPGVKWYSVALSAGGDVCVRVTGENISQNTRQAINSKFGDIPVEYEEPSDIQPY